MTTSEGVVCEGDHVVLDVNNGERLVVTHVTRKTKVKLSKRGYLNVYPLLGHAYGTIFEVSADGKHFKVGSKETLSVLNGSFNTTKTERNNANLVDDGTAQKLSHEEIEKLKSEGISGGDLIEKLVENSATFEGKTEFSQEKYKRKKQKKHCVAFVLCRPCSQLVCEAYFKKSPQRICGLRVDTVSLLLSFANVRAHGRTLVLEESNGLVLGSVLERMGGHGEVCAISPYLDTKEKLLEVDGGANKHHHVKTKGPSMEIVKYFNFEEEIISGATFATMGELIEAKAAEAKAGVEEERAEGVGTSDRGSVEADAEANGKEVESSERPGKKQKRENGTHGDNAADGGEHQKRKFYFPRKASREQMVELVRSGFSSLILAAPSYSPESLIDKLACILAPSASFAIFSPWLQPLADCRLFLHKAKLAVGMQLSETFWREHQVLPGRTHPHMNMITGATGGYILAGTMTAEVLRHDRSSDCEKRAIEEAAERARERQAEAQAEQKKKEQKEEEQKEEEQKEEEQKEEEQKEEEQKKDLEEVSDVSLPMPEEEAKED
ncbi:non-catalytic subunit Trm6 of tRNA (Adenine(58)-N(1))-methyltransferase [Chloropicon primus]|uniref:tRNA (adenine(58)-N(1))-methyltransferase non-catalytic subunit TRM6 n=1 Tax=Chloropicon primus TaxID=1764295 RepID=A0A5B8MDB9_9CHLO|nr:non-catalytic subunit Trm6 of tRNA (Adenine(58)-N(1))-methyltransferase [Chloropicon primus]UPQ97765.1 non-catalytic subunit Trm6 of tRNA (Adenine(58)-N(1))-methyltransferase [Chloropicon primus]|eukprot:QDZ18556.1 non-catalytic subunit Trm6 of tRNA (Adenine(58)-N(1))-methyltransferase [Chloropicon primus]